MNSLIGSGWDEDRKWTKWSELPCRHLRAAQAALLLSHLIRVLPSWQRSKFVYFFPLQDTALYKCCQMKPDKVINQFNRMKPCVLKGDMKLLPNLLKE